MNFFILILYSNGLNIPFYLNIQVLTSEQASTAYYRKSRNPETFTVPNITFNLDTSGATCNDLQYLCAEFNKGDSPDTRVGSIDTVISFGVYGVESETDLTFNPDSLIGCQPFTQCDGM